MHLPRFYVQTSHLTLHSSDTSSTTWFWHASNDYFPGNSDVNLTAGVYTTVHSVTGRGELTGLIGCVMANSTDTSQFRVTVDGVVHTLPALACTNFTNPARLYLGALRFDSSYFSLGSPVQATMEKLRPAASHRASSLSGGTNWAVIPQPQAAVQVNYPRVSFETSLLVEFRASANVTDTTNQERRVGCVYRLLT